jgi:two-component system phosphate regulon sensor histidine kinase PhoR
MIWRFVFFLLCQVIPATIVWNLAPLEFRAIDSLIAAISGSLVWLVLDALRASKVLRWLREGNTSDSPVRTGLWGEVFDRARRLVRKRDREKVDSDGRLQDFLAALQASPNGVVLLDAEGRIEWFNLTASSHFGFDARRDMLQHFGNLVRDPGFANYYANRDFQGDVEMPGRENNIAKPVKLSVHLHPYGDGRSLLLSRDITAVEQAEAMRRDFVANVSHEIRTPLTVLAGFVETLQTLSLSSTEKERYLALMSQQAERMQTLVSDLLMLSRLEGSPLPSSQDWVPMRALMAQCEQEAIDFSTVLWKRTQNITFEFSGDAELAGSATEIHSAMSNLIGNAIRYTPDDKSIKVRWQLLPNGSGVFSVIDQGAGIAPEHLPRLTERFYRVDRSRSRETGGTGLGLAIVKHVSQRHGAELGIESQPGKGSTFSITFSAQRIKPLQAAAEVKAEAEPIAV